MRSLIAIAVMATAAFSVAHAQNVTFPVVLGDEDKIWIRRVCDEARTNMNIPLEAADEAIRFCKILEARMNMARDAALHKAQEQSSKEQTDRDAALLAARLKAAEARKHAAPPAPIAEPDKPLAEAKPE